MTKIIRSPIPALLAGLSLLAAPALAEGPVQLRYKFAKGLKLSYQMQIAQGMELQSSTSPEPQQMKTAMDVDFHQKVLAVKPAGAEIEFGFDKVAAEAELGGQRMPVPQMESLDQVVLRARMSERGKMEALEVHNADALPPEAQKMAVEMKKSIAQNALVFPEGPLKKGASWEVEQRVPTQLGGGPALEMRVQSKYTYAGMEEHLGRQAARIETRVQVSLHGETTQMGVPVKADMEGAGDGQAWFLPEKGQLLHTRTEFLIKGKVVGEQEGQQMTTRMKIDTKAEMRLR